MELILQQYLPITFPAKPSLKAPLILVSEVLIPDQR